MQELEAKGIASILDYLGEHCTSAPQADSMMNAYLRSLDGIGSEAAGSHISVKLSQLGLDFSFEESLTRMERICAAAEPAGTTVAIDMESHEYTDRTIETYRLLRARFSNLVLCLQAHLKRTEGDVHALLPLTPAIRLCKGAYREPREITTLRRKTRDSFQRLMMRLMETTPYTAIATHDDWLIAEAKRFSTRKSLPKETYEFQMLYGVRRELQKTLAGEGYRVRVYIPFGDQWYPYLMRRLAERPANLRFFAEAILRG